MLYPLDVPATDAPVAPENRSPAMTSSTADPDHLPVAAHDGFIVDRPPRSHTVPVRPARFPRGHGHGHTSVRAVRDARIRGLAERASAWLRSRLTDVPSLLDSTVGADAGAPLAHALLNPYTGCILDQDGPADGATFSLEPACPIALSEPTDEPAAGLHPRAVTSAGAWRHGTAGWFLSGAAALRDLVRDVRTMLDAEAVVLAPVLDGVPALDHAIAFGVTGDPISAVGAAFCRRVTAECQPVMRSDTGSDAAGRRGARFRLGVPIRDEGGIVAVMCAAYPAPRRHTGSDIRLLQFAARMAASAIERARLNAPADDGHNSSRSSHQRMAFLLNASTQLSRSLDIESVLKTLTRLAVPDLADWCMVDLCAGDGALRRLALVASDPEQEATLREIIARYPPNANSFHPSARAVRAGRTYCSSAEPEGQWERFAQDDGHLQLLSRLGRRWYIAVPLMMDGSASGALTLCSVRRPYLVDDVILAEELARRVVTALANAQRFEAMHTALRVHDEMLATITHDLAQPLASIRTLAHVLREDQAIADQPDIMWMANRMVATAAKMAAMCHEVVDRGRLEAGRPLDLHRRPTDLVALVNQQVEMQQRTTDAHTIRIDAEPSELIGNWDEPRLERVVNNLIGNAIKYSPDGGEIVISVALEPPAGVDTTDDDPRWARVSVRDPGVGIPADDLPVIFERFHRGKNVVGKFKGTGLGLSGSRHIVEQHGGTLTVDSREGQGSTFVLQLPLA
jgi:signal transduction histidine kinase